MYNDKIDILYYKVKFTQLWPLISLQHFVV